jgi:murein DD-endopeptidase MepM/ murein hydrolase activator NlpD
MRTWLVVLALLAAGCDQQADTSEGDRTPRPSTSSAPTPSVTRSETPHPSVAPKPQPDPRWVFFTSDRTRFTSPWFDGSHQVMIPFGCTPAPYYDPDPSCPDGQGSHHGIDIAIPCGTPLLAGRPAKVLANDALGPAYGENPVLLRVGDRDVVIGHTRRVFVEVGDRVETGERFALVGDSAAPDGCHLHFEVRPAGAGYLDAVDPLRLLDLTRPS